MQTEVVTGADRLAEIGPAWDALWRRGERSVFQSHGWVAAWWHSLRPEHRPRLRVGLCWVGDGLAAVMPLVTRRHRGVRVLEWAAKDCSDYCDALVATGAAENGPALEQLWAAIAASGGFDLAYMSHIRPGAALYSLLDRRPRALRLEPGRRSARSLQVRYGASDGQAWFQGLDPAMRDRHASGLRAIGNIAPVSSEMHAPSDATDALIARMVSLKRQQLADENQSYAILDDDASTFHALTKELARQHMLQVFSMHCGDQLVAALLNITDGTRAQVFFAAYDPRFADAGPETLAMVEFIIAALDLGVTEIDLLCVGDNGTYKFTNAHIKLASYVGARTLLGRLALAVGERLERQA